MVILVGSAGPAVLGEGTVLVESVDGRRDGMADGSTATAVTVNAVAPLPDSDSQFLGRSITSIGYRRYPGLRYTPADFD